MIVCCTAPWLLRRNTYRNLIGESSGLRIISGVLARHNLQDREKYMKIRERSATAFVVTLGLVLGAGISLKAADGPGWYQGYPAPYMDMRGLVDRTQSDLRDAAELEHGNDHQRGRYRSAQGHLSTFDRHLTRGRFDNGELDKSIGSIKGILDHNVLQARSRDALMRDVADLRGARARRW